MNVKNRRCIRRLSFRTFRASGRRNLIAVASIALTALLFTSLFTVAMSIVSSYETYTFRQIGGYSHGSFKDVSKEQVQKIAAHPKVKETGERLTVGFITDGSFAKKPAEVSWMDENCTKWSYAVPEVGRMPREGREIAMDIDSLKLLGIEPELGAQIPLTYTLAKGGQISGEKTDTFTLTGWWEYDEIGPVHYINISEEYAGMVEAENIAEGEKGFRRDLNVMMASALDIRGQMEQVDLDLGYVWDVFDEPNSARIGVNWGYASAQLGSKLDTGMVLAIASFLFLVIFTGYLIIYNIFQISVVQDIRFYGLLKTIGITPRQLHRIIRLQALFLCSTGIPAGLLAGYGVGAVLTPVVMTQVSIGAESAVISTSPLIFVISALFALFTVLISCSRPGRMASRVSPVEATKYTEAASGRKKKRAVRGARVYQMAFANLGRNKSKTVLVVISLALSVVLLNLLVTIVGGFNMDKYLDHSTCADFIVGGTDYFRSKVGAESCFSGDIREQIEENTDRTLSGCGYGFTGKRIIGWMPEDTWRSNMEKFLSADIVKEALAQQPRKGELLEADALIEGLDRELFEKLTVVEGSLDPLFEEGSSAIAVAVRVDDYGRLLHEDFYPEIGENQIVTYIKDGYYIDRRTGERCTEDTPEEYLQYHITDSYDVNYTVCAYVSVPQSMSYRYGLTGYDFVLPAERFSADSEGKVTPMFYLFDTPDSAAEEAAEQYLADLTGDESSVLMYESKATLRDEFAGFRNIFLLLGGLLCSVIGVVGVLNFFNAVLTGILSRRREFAMLQAMGMTNKQLRAMLVYEGLFYALAAALTALLLALVLNRPAGNLMEGMFWFFEAKSDLTCVLAAIPVFGLLGWLIPYSMYGQAAKHSVVERLRESE